MRFITVCALLALVVMPCNAKDVIRSAVPAHLMDGLHAKYLHYLAKQMDMQLQLQPMPFARRLRALRHGELDIMVGLQRTTEEKDEVVYITPSYGSVKHTFFIHRDNYTQLTHFEHLKNMKIGVTKHAKYYDRFNQQANLATVGVNTVQQKIQLLMEARIDTFIHYEDSTFQALKDMGLEGQVIKAEYQPEDVIKYYVTISANSSLMAKKQLVESVVEKGVERGDFIRIRREHYAEIMQSK